MKLSIYIIFLITCLIQFNCTKTSQNKVIDRVVVIVIDGARNSDINDDSLSEYNSGYQEMKKQGLYFSNFINAGLTLTQNGMSNIITGNQETMTNNGAEISSFPNFFHYYLDKTQISNDKTWIVTSKDKLESLKNTTHASFINSQRAKSNSGVNGLGTGYRSDSITYQVALDILKTNQPNLAFITFREPDYSGHQGKWSEYLKGMKNSIAYTQSIIDFINTDEYYRGRTLVLITNDHGRHLNGIADGFVSHGDGCQGCRHITLLAISPNIIPNSKDETSYSQDNIAPTIARILGFDMPTATSPFIKSIY
jgi:Sulfatase